MIGKMLRFMRTEKGFRQTELAKELNIAQTTLSGYETQYSNPDFKMIEEIAELCGFEVVFRYKETKKEYSVEKVQRKDF